MGAGWTCRGVLCYTGRDQSCPSARARPVATGLWASSRRCIRTATRSRTGWPACTISLSSGG